MVGGVSSPGSVEVFGGSSKGIDVGLLGGGGKSGLLTGKVELKLGAGVGLTGGGGITGRV